MKEKELVKLLEQLGFTMSTAESLTAGLVADAVVSIPGVSDVFVGGAVCYIDRIKTELLGVSAELLREKTAICSEVAAEMARGCAKRFSSDCAVSTTGLAGPATENDPAPVGTVYIGVFTPYGERVSYTKLDGDRSEVRKKAASLAIELLYNCLISCTGGIVE